MLNIYEEPNRNSRLGDLSVSKDRHTHTNTHRHPLILRTRRLPQAGIRSSGLPDTFQTSFGQYSAKTASK